MAVDVHAAWMVTRRTDGVYTVDDANARQGTSQSDFVLAAVVVKKDDLAGTEAQLKACAERATECAQHPARD
jgi:hypothetical protein